MLVSVMMAQQAAFTSTLSQQTINALARFSSPLFAVNRILIVYRMLLKTIQRGSRILFAANHSLTVCRMLPKAVQRMTQTYVLMASRPKLNDKKILLVNTRMSDLGSDQSDFIGSFIISVILREISRQGENDPSKRIPVQLLIDEFQTYSGVPWQELLAQLRKWGGRTVLGTQSFASMMTEDSRDLPGIIMSGVYSIFAFTVNGEDAEYLSSHELSEKFGGPSRDTLISLDPYTCYARIMRQDGKLSRPFFFRTASPVIPDSDIRIDVLDMRDDYARKRNETVAEALDYLDRIEKYRFYSSGQITVAGSDGDISVIPGKGIPDPDKRGKKLKTRKKDTEKDKQVTDEEINHDETDDQKRDRMLEGKYGDLPGLH